MMRSVYTLLVSTASRLFSGGPGKQTRGDPPERMEGSPYVNGQIGYLTAFPTGKALVKLLDQNRQLFHFERLFSKNLIRM